MDGLAELRERHAVLRIGVERGACPFDDDELTWQAAGPAALAIAQARGSRSVERVEERDILAAREP
jgi:hypothetical protein